MRGYFEYLLTDDNPINSFVVVVLFIFAAAVFVALTLMTKGLTAGLATLLAVGYTVRNYRRSLSKDD